MDSQEWPEQISFRFRGADEEQKESGEFLAKAGAGALFLMFIILVTQFNSFYQTVLTLSTVILAVVGVLIGMLIFGQKFSIIMTGTGIIALAGIVVNNAIVLIDTYNRLRDEGASVHDAILKTSGQRIRPIMLTTITTIMGLVPMAMQVNLDFFAQTISIGSITAIWWVQLSIAIISGLAFSTILTLFLIPVMLAFPTNVVNSGKWVGSLFSRKPVAVAEEPVMAEAIAVPVGTGDIAVEAPTPEPEIVEEAPKKKPAAARIPKKRKVPVKKAASPRRKTSSKKTGTGQSDVKIVDAAE